MRILGVVGSVASSLMSLVPLLSGTAVAQPTPAIANTQLAPIGGIKKQATEVEAKGFLGVIGQNITPQATLLNRATHQPIANKGLNLVVGGIQSGITFTNAAGVATFHYHVPNKPPGSWPVEIRFTGDNELLPSSVSVTAGIFQASTKLTLKLTNAAASLHEGGNFPIEVRLVRTSDDEGLDGRAVTMTVNGKAAGKPTTGNGRFTFDGKIPAGTAPTAHIQAQFEGDALYAATAGTFDVAVLPPLKKAKLFTVGPAPRGRRGETVHLKGILVPENPMIVVNGGAGGLRVFFSGRTGDFGAGPTVSLCGATSLPDGRLDCAVKLDFPAKGYGVDGIYDRNQGAWAIENDLFTNLHIDPAPVKLTVSGPSAARIGDTIHVKLHLIRTTDNGPVASAPVSVDGKSATTNASGDATITFAVPSQGGAGARQLKATFGGQDGFYLKDDATLVIQVSPNVS